MVTVEIKAKLQWRSKRTERGYVATCEMLGVAAQGETWPELHATIAEVVQELFLDLLNDGELEDFLRRKGWQAMAPLPAPQSVPDVRFDVPYTVAEPSRAAAQ